MVSTSDTAFMWMSLDPQIATEYVGSCGNNVLWELQLRLESDATDLTTALRERGATTGPLGKADAGDGLLSRVQLEMAVISGVVDGHG